MMGVPCKAGEFDFLVFHESLNVHHGMVLQWVFSCNTNIALISFNV